MQQSWAEDEDKCTFILIDKSKSDVYVRIKSRSCMSVRRDEEAGMIGDVNLFFNDHDDHTVAELEVMIAEPAFRGRGIGMCPAAHHGGLRTAQDGRRRC